MREIPRSWLALGIFAILVVFSLAVRTCREQEKDRIRMEEEIRAQKVLIAAKDQSIGDANQRIEQRNRELGAQVKQIEALKARPATVREIAREIPAFVPMPSQPGVEASNPQAGTQKASEAAPERPSEKGQPAEQPEKLVFTGDQADALRAFYLDCHEKALQLDACGQDRKDWAAKEKAWSEKYLLIEHERDVAVQTVKGGTFWRRFKRSAKAVGISIAVGVGIGAVLAH